MKLKCAVSEFDGFCRAFVQGMVASGKFTTPKEIDSLLDLTFHTGLKYSEKRAAILLEALEPPEQPPEPPPEPNPVEPENETDFIEALTPFENRKPPETEVKVKSLTGR